MGEEFLCGRKMGDSSACHETGLVLVGSVTDRIALFMCPGLYGCVFGTNFSPSFILLLPSFPFSFAYHSS